jgi:hypothetical protein
MHTVTDQEVDRQLTGCLSGCPRSPSAHCPFLLCPAGMSHRHNLGVEYGQHCQLLAAIGECSSQWPLRGPHLDEVVVN